VLLTTKRREKNKSAKLKSREVTKNEDTQDLRAIIDEVNRRALRDELSPHEVVEIRDLLPHIKELLEANRRTKWLLKLVGMFLLAAPAVAAIGQGLSKIVDWIRGQ